MIVAGNGALISGAGAAVESLAQELGAPVATSFVAKGLIPEDHPLSVGIVGWLGHPVAHEFIRERADVVLAIGYRFADQSTSWRTEGKPFVRQNRIIQIDIDPREVARAVNIELGLQGDCLSVIGDLIAEIQRLGGRTGSSESARTVQAAMSGGEIDLSADDARPMEPLRVAHQVRNVLPDASALSVDTGNHAHYFSAFYPIRKGGMDANGVGPDGDNRGQDRAPGRALRLDHGHYFGEHGLQGKAGPLYEEISHQVLQVRHPDGIGRGKRIGGIVQPAHFAPTILDMLGIDAPAEMEIQGTSWFPLLTGGKRSILSTAIYGNWPMKVTGDMRRQPSMHLPSGWSTLTATNRDWALIDHPNTARRELYHLPSDIGQANNVIADNPEVADRLHREVTRFLRRNKAPRWMQRLYAEGLDEMEMPEPTEFMKCKSMRGMPHATPLDGNVF